jgi:hypothetical protein
MNKVHHELEQIRSSNETGILIPGDVVEWARKHKHSALYKRFCWDDDKAASEYRLWQAREIIRVSVTVIEGRNKPVDAYVSFFSNRCKKGGGYIAMVDILSNKKLYNLMLKEALDELKRMEVKYKELQELQIVFRAVKTIKRSF